MQEGPAVHLNRRGPLEAVLLSDSGGRETLLLCTGGAVSLRSGIPAPRSPGFTAIETQGESGHRFQGESQSIAGGGSAVRRFSGSRSACVNEFCTVADVAHTHLPAAAARGGRSAFIYGQGGLATPQRPGTSHVRRYIGLWASKRLCGWNG